MTDDLDLVEPGDTGDEVYVAYQVISVMRDDLDEDDADEVDDELVDAGEGYDDLPTGSFALAELALHEAGEVEAWADAVAGLSMIAEGLYSAMAACCKDGEIGPAFHANYLAGWVHKAADRALEARGVATRSIDRIHELVEQAGGTDQGGEVDDKLYVDILTARLHIPMAESILQDAMNDGVLALRNFARAALVTADDYPDTWHGDKLVQAARGVLRFELPGLPETHLYEEPIRIWALAMDSFALEMAGWLAQMLLEHRSILIVENPLLPGRYVQVITYERGLHCESVGDEFLDTPLTPAEVACLEEIGWEPPDADGSPNWSLTWDGDLDVRAVASILATTLEQVHHVDDPAELAVSVDPSGALSADG